jgi:hypothetical protein
VTVAAFYAYLNSTYANDAAKRGELAGIAYRFQQYQGEGFSASVARGQGQFGRRAERLAALGEATNYGGLT